MRLFYPWSKVGALLGFGTHSRPYKQLSNAVNVNMILEIRQKIDLFLANKDLFPKSEATQISLSSRLVSR